MYTHVTNTVTDGFRIDNLDGRMCLVGPCIMLGNGTWSGSGGPVTYTEEVLNESVQEWNHRPVLVNHPASGSGCDVNVINQSKVGSVQNTKVQDGKLSGELWITLSRCKELAPDVLLAIENGKMLEVSTGLFGRVDNSGNILDIQPDHLAILPHDVGAYSIQAGAGFPRWNKKLKVGMNDVIGMLYKAEALKKFCEDSGLYIEDIGTDWFTFSKFDEEKEELYQASYKMDGASLVIDENSFKEVERITEYLPKKKKDDDMSMNIGQKEITNMAEDKTDLPVTEPQSVVLNSVEEVFASDSVTDSVKETIKNALDFQKEEHSILVQAVMNHEMNVLGEDLVSGLPIGQLREMKAKLDAKVPVSIVAHNLQSAPPPDHKEAEVVKPLMTNAWK